MRLFDPFKLYFVLLSTLIILRPGVLYADDIRVTANVDRTQIELGDSLQLSIRVNSIRGNEDPVFPAAVRDHFDILSRGSSTNVQIVNGQINTELTHTYLLSPKNTGTFALGPIPVRIGGKDYYTDPITITVEGGNAPSTTGSPSSSPPVNAPPSDPWGAMTSQPRAQAGAPYFAEAEVSDPTPFLNQQILYTFRFYNSTRVDEARLALPHFDSFFKEEVVPENKYSRVIDGKQYLVTEKVFALFPSKAGPLHIEPAKLHISVPSEVNTNPFFSFPNFRMGQSEAKTLQTQSFSIDVKPLPEPEPDHYSNLVGHFSLNMQIDRSSLDVQQSLTATVELRGSGNIGDGVLPPWTLPPTFKVYADQPVTETQKTPQGIQGVKRFRFVLIPSQPGEYTLPAITLSALNPESGEYETLSTQAMSITVTGTATPKPASNADANPSTSSASEEPANAQPTPFDIRPLTHLQAPTFHLNTVNPIVLFAALCLPPLTAFALVIGRFLNARRKANLSKTRRSRALKTARRAIALLLKRFARLDANQALSTADLEACVRLIQDYFAAKWSRDRASAITSGDIHHVLSTGIEGNPQTIKSDELASFIQALHTFESAIYGGKSLSSELAMRTLQSMRSFLEAHDVDC